MEEDEVKVEVRVEEAVGVLDQAVTVFAQVAERKHHTRWEPLAMSSNVQNAELR